MWDTSGVYSSCFLIGQFLQVRSKPLLCSINKHHAVSLRLVRIDIRLLCLTMWKATKRSRMSSDDSLAYLVAWSFSVTATRAFFCKLSCFEVSWLSSWGFWGKETNDCIQQVQNVTNERIAVWIASKFPQNAFVPKRKAIDIYKKPLAISRKATGIPPFIFLFIKQKIK